MGLKIIGTGSWPAALRAATMCWELAATWLRVSGPKRCWVPVANQTSAGGRGRGRMEAPGRKMLTVNARANEAREV